MKIIVQKFGGTSVSSQPKRLMVINKIKTAIHNGYKPVIVVSAMGRKDAPYATDTLLSLISDEFKTYNALSVDLLVSCGEIITTVVMCDELNRKGFDAVPLTGGQAGIITDDNFNNAEVLRVDTRNILSIIEQNKIPVVAGFQGITENGFITTLGRGGSDVSAALLGTALNAEEVEIYTDVDGIMTADPRIVAKASLIKELSYNEVFQLADYGAKVIHPRAVEIAMKSNIPLVIKNTMSDCSGTMINNQSIQGVNRIITGITHLSDRVQVCISAENNTNNNHYKRLLAVLAENGISIDLINVFPGEQIFTIDSKALASFKDIMNGLQLNFSYIENCSKITVIGSGMRGIPGVMAKILKALSKENIEVLQTADSHTTIWCLVKSSDTEKAINALHDEFKLG